jgi:hypothetical protein
MNTDEHISMLNFMICSLLNRYPHATNPAYPFLFDMYSEMNGELIAFSSR